MSYILDSLKKSDQERKRGSVPGVLSDHGGSGPEPGNRRRRRWPPLLGGFLLLNGAALAFWIQPWRAAEPVTPVAATAAVPVVSEDTTQLAAAAPEVRTRPEREVAAAPRMPIEAEGAPPARPPAVEEGGPETPPRTGGAGPQAGDGWRGPATPGTDSGNRQTEAAEPGVEEGRPGGPDGGAVTDDELGGEPGEAEAGAAAEETILAPPEEGQARNGAELPRADGAEEPAAAPEEELPEEAAPEAGITGPDEAATTPPEPADAGSPRGEAAAQPEAPPELDRLPPATRNELPEIHISAHFFSKKPASRLVSVNGRILREGQEMDGLKVQEITPSGVIFMYRGRKFLKTVF